ncbi:fas-binding factor 1 homolog [Drosophila tropicalis]|uniref:fas-binding factor 1 homolog n=1 Tax=Drosophila tropicalis TaxID=46794 RepID=UPI0035AB9651
MNFNDDPLAELLSDNSLDNDNFFDTPSGGNLKKPSSGNKSSKIVDLFGIQEETEADVQSPADVSSKSKPIVHSTPRIVKQKPSLSLDDDAAVADDDDLGFDPKRPKSGGARKNLFDDLLPAAEPKKNIFDDILSRPATAKPSMSRQSTDTTTENSQARPKTSTGRRSSAQSAIVNADPLGLFGKDAATNANVSGMSTPVSKKRGATSTTADWLGLEAGPSQIEERPPTPRSPQTVKESVVVPNPLLPTSKMPDSEEENRLPIMAATAGNSATQNILLLNSLNLESSHKFEALQQQESQFLIAAQMKSQERALLEMQRRQEDQDRKFQSLIQQQLQRQQQMEEHIKVQQQRINMHIQLMMAQPVHIREMETVEKEEEEQKFSKPREQEKEEKQAAKQEEKKDHDQLLQLESDVKRNMLEKLRLEELVANMKVNYEQEIEMIEGSYKKQLKVLEDHLSAVEERLKSENGELRQYYLDKLEKLKVDYTEQITNLKQDQEDEVRKLRNSHEMDLEAIRQAKLLEMAALQNHGNYMETLRTASNNLQELSNGLTTGQDRQRQLEVREKRLDDQERRLKIDEENADEEKRRLMELVSTLELQLGRLSKESAEENWQLRQRMASLEAEKKAFENEKSFHREQMERDEKRIEELKTLQLAETERLHHDLQQERSRIAVERQQLEMRQQLHDENGHHDQERMELEAQLKVARDAIRRADEERERCHKLQREVEQRKRLLLDKENALNLREDELAQSSSAYRMATGRCQMVEHKARETEQLLQAKLQLLGKRAHELSEKEAQLSQERMLLAQDRITLHNLKKQIAQSRCALCKMGAESAELTLRMDRKAKHLTQNVTQHTDPADFLLKISTASPGPAAGLTQTDIVERMLDENIEASYRRMYNVPPGGSSDVEYDGLTSGLDDDSKKMAMDNGKTLDLEHMF